jgi:hypothetical protein
MASTSSAIHVPPSPPPPSQLQFEFDASNNFIANPNANADANHSCEDMNAFLWAERQDLTTRPPVMATFSALYSTIILLGLFGNACVIVAIARIRSLQTVPNMVGSIYVWILSHILSPFSVHLFAQLFRHAGLLHLGHNYPNHSLSEGLDFWPIPLLFCPVHCGLSPSTFLAHLIHHFAPFCRASVCAFPPSLWPPFPSTVSC